MSPLSPEVGDAAQASAAGRRVGRQWWKGMQMLLKCYQQPDPDTILAVMNEPSKLGDQWEAATGRGRGLRAPTEPRALKA